MSLSLSKAETLAPSAAFEASDLVSSDAELMRAVAGTDPKAFTLLMRRYLKNMIAIAQRILGNTADADEVAQEAFLRLWKHAPAWDPSGKATLKTWLSRVVINLCLDRLRRKKSVSLEEAGEILDPTASAYEKTQQEDKRRIVQEALNRLPNRQRIALVLSYFEDMSGAEIANAMGTSIRAVESLLVRGKKSLRDYLRDIGITEGGDL